jgi:hypothetical protein
MVALLGAWTVISARAISGGAQRWLSFSEAAALVGLAIVGLIAHEAAVQRRLRAARVAAQRERRRATEPRALHPEHERARRVVSG